MAQKRFYWLKLHEDFFRQVEIKKLRQIAGGDTYVIIYLKLLLLSLKTGGKLYYEGVDEDFASEMALTIDEAVDNVEVTVNFLIVRGILIQNTAEEFELTTCAEMTGSETDSARRMRNYRQLHSAQCDTLPSHCSVNVRDGDTEIEKREIKEKKKSMVDKPPRAPRFTPPTLEEVAAYVKERGSIVDPQGFIDFYAAKGWLIGKSQMRDWKAACRNAEKWERWQRNGNAADKPFRYDPGDLTGDLSTVL